MSRWIRVQTSIFDHELFSAEPLTEREAWLWLVSKAAWKETRHRIGQSVHPVPVGSLFVTLREMQNAWKWKSDTRVRSFLAMLEDEGMIELTSDAGKTQVSICNYSKYQEVERTDNAEKTHEKRTKDTNTPDIDTSSLRSDVPAQAPEKPSVKSELSKVLDADHVRAVVDHRNRIRKPLTPHAAELLAGKFSRCTEPNAAADAMVANGWQGFEPEWLDNRNSQRGQGPPSGNRRRNYVDAALDLIREQDDGTENSFGNGSNVEFLPPRKQRSGSDVENVPDHPWQPLITGNH